MSEYGILFTLECPAGDGDPLLLNDFTTSLPVGGKGLVVQEVAGLNTATIRNPTFNRPGQHGGYARPFFKGGGLITFSGLLVAATPADRQTVVDRLFYKTNLILQVDGILKWTPPGGALRQRKVRIYDGPLIDNGDGVKTFTFTLFSIDPTWT